MQSADYGVEALVAPDKPKDADELDLLARRAEEAFTTASKAALKVSLRRLASTALLQPSTLPAAR